MTKTLSDLPSLAPDATPEQIARHRVMVSKALTAQRNQPLPKQPPRHSLIEEKLSSNAGHVRHRIAAPFTLIEESVARAVSRLESENDSTFAEPPIKPTPLDNALAHYERTALSQYIVDRSALLEKGGAKDRQAASQRLAYVNRYLSFEDRHELDLLTGMILPTVHDSSSVIEIGCEIAATTDHKTAEGAFIGTFRKLAQRLNHLHRLYSTKKEIR